MDDIQKYIDEFSGEKAEKLNELYHLMQTLVPNGEAIIKYGMPTIYLRKNIVHFASFKHHIGFYPGPETIAQYQQSLTAYKTSKGAIQFPLTSALPTDLITKMIKSKLNNLK